MAAAGAVVNVTITRSDDPAYSGKYVLSKKEDVIKIGRSPANDVKVTTFKGISAHHAEIRLAEQLGTDSLPVLHVRDLSSNGTGRQLPGSKEVVNLEKGIDTELIDGAVLVVPVKTVRAGTDTKGDEQRVLITVRYERQGSAAEDTSSAVAAPESKNGEAVPAADAQEADMDLDDEDLFAQFKSAELEKEAAAPAAAAPEAPAAAPPAVPAAPAAPAAAAPAATSATEALAGLSDEEKAAAAFR
mmetsp:Transcript_21750/g.37248  ORF Transcript_21750/g.37248 Transcript_21750/m.37248 type:complete len:244 (+) Transcript_21750:100-831(+)